MTSLSSITFEVPEQKALRDLDGSYKKYSQMSAIKKVITKIIDFFKTIIDTLKRIFTPKQYCLELFKSWVEVCTRIDKNIYNVKLDSVQILAIKKTYQFMINLNPAFDTKTTFPNMKKIYHSNYFSFFTSLFSSN
jgi:hypothetical protein